eukprot:890305-Rhodomonas_salina.1
MPHSILDAPKAGAIRRSSSRSVRPELPRAPRPRPPPSSSFHRTAAWVCEAGPCSSPRRRRCEQPAGPCTWRRLETAASPAHTATQSCWGPDQVRADVEDQLVGIPRRKREPCVSRSIQPWPDEPPAVAHIPRARARANVRVHARTVHDAASRLRALRDAHVDHVADSQAERRRGGGEPPAGPLHRDSDEDAVGVGQGQRGHVQTGHGRSAQLKLLQAFQPARLLARRRHRDAPPAKRERREALFRLNLARDASGI